MQTRLVYRIEDADGLGPFQSEAARDAIDAWNYNFDVDNYPDPRHDEGFDFDALFDRVDEEKWSARVGCCSPEQLQHWFDEEQCQALAALGYSFVTYQVDPDYLVSGEFQAVFDRNHAETAARLAACALWAKDTQQRLAA
jgi:hypothetical protein